MEGEIKKSGLNKRVKIPQKCMMWGGQKGEGCDTIFFSYLLI